jgi:hypothetical protein
MHKYAFFAGRPFTKKWRLFLKKSNVRFFQKQPVFFIARFREVESAYLCIME